MVEFEIQILSFDVKETPLPVQLEILTLFKKALPLLTDKALLLEFEIWLPFIVNIPLYKCKIV
jgi:hypothetical protein